MPNAAELLSSLATEQLCPEAAEIDTLSPLEIVTVMNAQDVGVALAVRQALPEIAKAVETITKRLRAGGRLFYIGAGTSGRLGVLDASECPPTFSVENGLVVGVIAGGDGALRNAIEGAEDSEDGGARDLAAHGLNDKDAVVAISASGFAPYCAGALRYAAQVGAARISLCCNKGARLSGFAEIAIEMPTGPEVVSGSTRLKAGTATKMALNMLSTATMILLGKTYKNMMVDVRATNQKLRERAITLTMRAADVSRAEAESLLAQAGGSVKTAVVMALLALPREEAEKALAKSGGSVRETLAT